ncbi:DUF6417 family protein [Streptomyces bobili]|uniref:DUF6417 family protein n=1 Tax=Streptomyces bobili TaxID=67280 RepID=UPI00379B45BD
METLAAQATAFSRLPQADQLQSIDLDDIVFAPGEYTTERLALLSLEEAHDLLRLLLAVTHDGGELSAEADRRLGRSRQWVRPRVRRTPRPSYRCQASARDVHRPGLRRPAPSRCLRTRPQARRWSGSEHAAGPGGIRRAPPSCRTPFSPRESSSSGGRKSSG